MVRGASPASSPPRAPAERWLPFVFAALAVLLLGPLWLHPFAYADKSDWRHFQAAMEVARRSVVWYHQVPLWNPWFCGGEVLLANAQSEVASPTFLLPLLFGTALGVKLTLAALVFCAFDGMYRLARHFDASMPAALLASILFGTSGWLALHILVGHTNFVSVALFPYLTLFYRRACSELAWSLPLGLVAAVIVGLGGSSTPAMAAVLLVTIATTDAVAGRTWRPYLALGAGAACAALFGAVRVLPAFEFAIDHPRRQWETDATSLGSMLLDAVRWANDVPLRHHRYRFHEYGWHFAYVAMPLVLWSLALGRARRWWIVWIVGAALVAGAALPYGPWWLLKHVPIYRDLRVPSRYTVLFAFAVPLLAAIAFDDVRARLRGRDARLLGRALPAVVLALAALDGTLFFWGRLRVIPFVPAPAAQRSDPFFQVQGHWSTMMGFVLQNQGVIACDEEAPLQRAAALQLEAAPQVWLLDPAAGTVQYRWTPNRIVADVALARPTTLLVNENWNEHFGTTVGRIVKFGPKWPADRDGGQLGVALPAGTYRVAVYYRPRSFVVGLVLTLVSLPLGLLLWIRRRRDRQDVISRC